MRTAIAEQVLSYKKGHNKCIKCGSTKLLEVDHCGDKEFKQLADEFLADKTIDNIVTRERNFLTTFDITNETIKDFVIEWQKYHKDQATLQTLCKSCHRQKTYCSATPYTIT